MTRFIFTNCLLILSIAMSGQVFDTLTILKNGPDDNKIVLAFLGDGYLNTQFDKYESDVQSIVDDIFKKSPFKEYKSYFNVYAIKVPSNEEGAANSPSNLIDNYFGSSFNTSGIQRLLVPTKRSTIYSVLDDNLPNYDQAFVIVNSTTYGGSGGQYATSSVNSSASEIAIHEIGHSFANLADEYWFRVQERPNQTADGSSETIKWKNWLGENGVGIYPHAENPSQFRPHQSCKMRALNNEFCSVCGEAFIEEFYKLVSNIESYSPAQETTEGIFEYSVDVLAPLPNTLKIEWLLNNQVIARNVNSIDVRDYTLLPNNNLTVNILDTTLLTRKASHETNNTYTVTWDFTNDIVGTSLTSVNSYFSNMQLYPNPTDDGIYIDFKSSLNESFEVGLYSLTGQKIWSEESVNLTSEGLYHIDLKTLNVQEGTYLVKVQLDDQVISEKVFVDFP